MKKMNLYTKEQVHQIVDEVLLKLNEKAVPDPEPVHLENEKAQCKLSPHAKLTCTVSEAAQILGVSKPTMYELIHKGAIPSTTVGRKILISQQVLTDWLKNGGAYGKEAC